MDVISVGEISELDCVSSRDDYFVVQICRVDDVPTYNNGCIYQGARQDVFVKAYLSKDLTVPGQLGINDFAGPMAQKDYAEYLRSHKAVRQIGRLSDYHFTLRKHDEGSAIWNSYHNFKYKSVPANALLTVELYHASRKQTVQAAERILHHGETPDEAHGLLGSVHVPISALEGEPKKFLFDQASKKYFPNFGIYLRRVYKDHPPKRIKTFFLVRHGESKWNLAQEHRQISGMLHRDHSLTRTGADQASKFNSAWRKYVPDATTAAAATAADKTHPNLEAAHDAEVAGYCQEVLTADDRKHHRKHHLESESGLREAAHGHASSAGSSSQGCMGYFSGLIFGAKSNEQESHSRPVRRLSKQSSEASADGVDDTRSRSSSQDMDHDGHGPGASSKDNSVKVTPEKAAPVPHGSVSRNAPGGAPITASTAHVRLKVRKERSYTEQSLQSIPDSGYFESQKVGAETETDELFAEGENGEDDVSRKFPGNLSSLSHTGGTSQFSTATEMALRAPKMLVSRRVEYIRQFLSADGIYVSPLTRAIQTALFALDSHPTLKSKGMNIMSTIREYKGPGGLDTVGRECGTGIMPRVISETADILGEAEAGRITRVPYALHDAELHWWTDINHYEGKRLMNDRMCEFLDFAQFCEAETPIFVGHSNFFRHFYANHMSEVVEYNRPHLAADMHKFRLSNACCLAVTVLFEEEDDDDAPVNVLNLNPGVHHGKAGSHHEGRKKHHARIIDADVVFSDARLSFANGSKAAVSEDPKDPKDPNAPQAASE